MLKNAHRTLAAPKKDEDNSKGKIWKQPDCPRV